MRDVVDIQIALVGREWSRVRDHLERYAARTLVNREGAFTLVVGHIALWCLDFFIPLANGRTLHPRLCTADVDKREDEPALIRKLLTGADGVCVIGESHDDLDKQLAQRRKRTKTSFANAPQAKDVVQALDELVELFARRACPAPR